MPDRFEYKDYHQSITDELHVLKNRLRDLVRYWREDRENSRSHWLSDGEWKESALRTILRRHLPNDIVVGRGFVLFKETSSTQIDILALEPTKPTVFKDGELFIVTPDVPRAIIEVKTRLDDDDSLESAVVKLCEIGRLCKDAVDRCPWLALFVYDTEYDESSPAFDQPEAVTRAVSDRILRAADRAFRETGVAVNCISFGRTMFLRYWPRGEWEEGDSDNEKRRASWRTYRLVNLAPAYFVGNAIDNLCEVDNRKSSFAWFTYHHGKRPHKIGETVQGRIGRRFGHAEFER